MKKFLSVVLSLSLLFGMPTIAEKEAYGYWPFELQLVMESGAKIVSNTSTLLGKIGAILEGIGQLGYKIGGISYGMKTLDSLGDAGKGLYEKVKLKFSKINQNVDTVIKELDKELQCIKGQDKAKNKIKETVASIIDARNEAKENDKPYGKGDVIYIPGPSGVGKTFSADCLARAIMGQKAEPIRIDSSCFDKSSNVSLKSQILYMRDQQKNNGSMSYYYVDNSLAAKIASNPNIVLIFDEYDKWCTPETDELLRAIMDKGVIYRDSERIDCSNLLVIVLSNEDHSSVTAGNGRGAFQDDGTGSRTHVVHDKSFLNRLQIIEFDNLYEDDYAEITQNQLKTIADRYGKNYNVNLDFGNVSRKVAIKVTGLNQGAREIAKILGGLRKALIAERNELGDSFKGKTFKVSYNPKTDKFMLKEKNGEFADEDVDEEENANAEETTLEGEQGATKAEPEAEETAQESEQDALKTEPETGKSTPENKQDAQEAEPETEVTTPEKEQDTKEAEPEAEETTPEKEPATEEAKG